MSQLVRDIRFAISSSLRRPGFTVVAVITLAFGLAACFTIFSIVNAALLKPLPFTDPEALMVVWETNVPKGIDRFPTSPANFLDWRDESEVFADAAAFRRANLDLTGLAEPERLTGAYVSEGFFNLLGVPPVVGRTLGAADADGSAVVASYGFWRRRLGGRADLDDVTLTLGGSPYRVVGVMPPEFDTPRGTDLWLPLSLGPEESSVRDGRFLLVYGRLKDGMSVEQAQTRMDALARSMGERHPATNRGWGVRLVPAKEQLVGEVRPALLTLMGAVIFVLLIACSNIANLLLARSQERQSEFALRVALGAERETLARQVLTESLVLTLVGGICGILISLGLLRLLPALGSADLAWLDRVDMDLRVAGFALLLSLITGVVVGLVPLLQLSRSNLSFQLRQGAARGTTGSERQVFRRFLVISELASAFVLLIGAVLLIQSYWSLQSVDPGFETKNVLTFRTTLSDSRYPEESQWSAFYDAVLENLRGMPGVEGAAAGTTLPFTAVQLVFDFVPQGGNGALDNGLPSARLNVITPDYFETMRVPLLSGRTFTSRDDENGQLVVIVNRTLAQRYLGGDDAVGQSIRVGGVEEDPHLVVGVVGDVRENELAEEASPALYVPYRQNAWEFMTFAVRTSGDPEDLVREVRSAVLSVDRDQPIFELTTMEDRVAESLLSQRFSTVLLTSFAILALTLALGGVYALISFLVAKRTREVGLRLALGAQRSDLLRLILTQTLKMVAVGVGVGLLLAVFLVQVIEHLLYGVSATDPVSFAVLALVLAGVAAMAGYFPARRATRIDPVTALRYE